MIKKPRRVLFNFKDCFADDVASEIKRQTMRPRRKNPVRVGDIAVCYHGLRTKKCVKLGEWPVKRVVSVVVGKGWVKFYTRRNTTDIGRCFAGGGIAESLAKQDGFESFSEMSAFFKKQYGRLPVKLELTQW